MNTMPHLSAPLEVIADVNQQDFRDAMSKMGAAVNIITTDGPAGRAGFAATAVCSVTDSPATLLICLNRTASVFNAVMENKVLCVNVLNAQHEKLSSLFGGKTPVDERFAAAQWHQGVTGAPVLDDAMVSFDCVISDMQDIGTHRVLFCVVKSVRDSGADRALIYYKRAYHHL
ncbi:pyrimidine utilization flavin reductase protein F [Agrobacterium rubi]|uniref:NADH-dependent FMN reductase RutF n=1 Tax=Agrobacterium rubi TaxID=28099 RepID=UPI0015742189|nr:pyrimidine utilization flavin reductase protein F [Agrobacterium rubi]NTF09016.1 pyrimidine utilization flavin reductase protein F [Agrobacterium rubi]NTF21287.1 pyrimidine utilization flavin reductase protein F [Agrobacterium rubi]NTF28144.1 pyrimidine utilization flavin reductase protein F [Agrobacterium rubi]